MSTSFRSHIRSMFVATVAFTSVTLLPGVASANLWPGWIRGSGALVLYTYDDSYHLLDLEWVSFPNLSELPVTVSDGAATITFWEDNGWLMAEVGVDLGEVFANDSTYTFTCDNHACVVDTCDQVPGYTCSSEGHKECVVTGNGQCDWVYVGSCDGTACGGGTPGDPPEHLFMPFAIAPFDPYGVAPVPPPPQ